MVEHICSKTGQVLAGSSRQVLEAHDKCLRLTTSSSQPILRIGFEVCDVSLRGLHPQPRTRQISDRWIEAFLLQSPNIACSRSLSSSHRMQAK